jgi:hypothetical protein
LDFLYELGNFNLQINPKGFANHILIITTPLKGPIIEESEQVDKINVDIVLEDERYKLLGLEYELLMFSMTDRCGGEVTLYSCPLSLLISQLRSVRPSV